MKKNKLSTIKGKLVAAAQILAITLLAACTIPGSIAARGVVGNGAAASGSISDGAATTTFTACRATGDPANPYEEIIVSYDISPVPASGCPAVPVSINDGKIAICHATGSQSNPYDLITVSVNGLNGHGDHEGDVFPGADGSCPATPGGAGDDTTTPTTVCHATNDPANPYEELTVNAAELNEHRTHPGDFNPAPVNGCPARPVVITDGKITICHATSSQTNPYNEITISVNGLNGHGDHEGDIIPAPDEGCPAVPLTPIPAASGDKITICHATGSKTNPYVEITVSVNGLNGHGDHEGDIIPAPAGGCPGS